LFEGKFFVRYREAQVDEREDTLLAVELVCYASLLLCLCIQHNDFAFVEVNFEA
jgi:hypothetical protein